VLCDYPEEGWVSMELVAEMLLTQLRCGDFPRIAATRVCPRFRRRATIMPGTRGQPQLFNFDRLLNRLAFYPRYVRRLGAEFDVFHVTDHSYAALVHALPAERTGVFCHDLDAFRSLLEPAAEPRPWWFRAMARRILAGMQRAAVVFYTSNEIRRQILEHKLVDASRLVQAPLGFSPEFTPSAPPLDEPEAAEVMRRVGGRPYLLHVGSCVPRKRIDLLLDVFAQVRGKVPGLMLVKVGGVWSAPQLRQQARLGIDRDVLHLQGVGRPALAALYRRSRLVLQTSDAEGFGIPIIEALACGAVVVASDISVLREVGGPAAVFCPPGNVAAWSDTVRRLLSGAQLPPPRDERLKWADRYSWSNHALMIAQTYEHLADATSARALRSSAV
jgi:glycosyltransferase involved in cell wall biosynthesis